MHYDPNISPNLTYNAFQYEVSAVMVHIMSNGIEIPVVLWSRTLQKSELNYALVDKEGLVIIFGV